jgi:hypothetical protein
MRRSRSTIYPGQRSCVKPRARHDLLALGASLLLAGAVAAGESYTFDVDQFKKKAFEPNGYVELRLEQAWLDREAAFYQLEFFDRRQLSRLARATGALELAGIYRRGAATLQGTVHGEAVRDDVDSDHALRVYEGYATFEPARGVRLEAGKRALRWGKGYAFNPVGFIERAKDPDDPDLTREGFVILGANLVRSFKGPLQTLALTAVGVPTAENLNGGFGEGSHVNPAAKISLLYRDTDFDFLFLGQGTRGSRLGFDLARNLTPNFAIHGEWARFAAAERTVLGATGLPALETRAATSYLVGLRYLTKRETTWIAELYHRGAGHGEAEARAFFAFAHDAHNRFAASGNETLLGRARALAGSYARSDSMRDYLYLRVNQKEPFDLLYFTPSLTLICNLEDHSRSLAPELTYTGITDLELRLRLFIVSGSRLTDFGEKRNAQRLELRVRYHF